MGWSCCWSLPSRPRVQRYPRNRAKAFASGGCSPWHARRTSSGACESVRPGWRATADEIPRTHLAMHHARSESWPACVPWDCNRRRNPACRRPGPAHRRSTGLAGSSAHPRRIFQAPHAGAGRTAGVCPAMCPAMGPAMCPAMCPAMGLRRVGCSGQQRSDRTSAVTWAQENLGKKNRARENIRR